MEPGVRGQRRASSRGELTGEQSVRVSCAPPDICSPDSDSGGCPHGHYCHEASHDSHRTLTTVASGCVTTGAPEIQHENVETASQISSLQTSDLKNGFLLYKIIHEQNSF